MKYYAANTDYKSQEILKLVAGQVDENCSQMIQENANVLSRFVVRTRLILKYKEQGTKRLKSEPVDGGVNYQIVPSQRGRDLLLYDGYTFHINKKYKDVIRWVCTASRRGCKASCQSSSGGWLTVFKNEHNHEKLSEEEIQNKTYKQEVSHEHLVLYRKKIPLGSFRIVNPLTMRSRCRILRSPLC